MVDMTVWFYFCKLNNSGTETSLSGLRNRVNHERTIQTNMGLKGNFFKYHSFIDIHLFINLFEDIVFNV